VAVRLGTTVSVNLARRGRLERALQRASMRHLYPRAAVVLVPSVGAADDLAAFAGLVRERITVVPSPVFGRRLEALAAEPPQGPPGPDAVPTVLGIGELCARKDFATLIRAFARLRAERPCRLVILGEGRQRQPLEALVRELGLAADVCLPGFVANPYPQLARAALFVLSSRCEGLPVALIEALACGTPAVSTDCPSGPRELLQGGRVGALVPVGDIDALVAAMTATLEKPPAAEVLRAAASPYAVQAAAGAYLDALRVPRPAALA
jgi:glycosyltransferase involved in cell wall biosynthesis